ncbi:cryptochrome/photolyase family protein [Maliponia aquimaris]|uniref:Deoxyribodipyrimidine photo-lyase-related protein n=1 Tax=Maliponia aquimaris TaxID=1673631 RepID=A0A238JPH7_9RHOB|nr:cryptochrome/photolyase family protein [Maliponia aquimaris]SMX32094.1 Deoxyribodipyrimidine photo-lyase-related protein [Maliponia aquimaris]
MSRLVLVLGDQLSDGVSALKAADKTQDIVVMAEVTDETGYVPHHPKKIALILAAMRKFAALLRAEGWDVRYAELDDTENAGSICGELLRRAEETGASEVIATEPGEWRLINALRHCPLKVKLLEDDRFIASHRAFDGWAEGRKALRMEYFYREMRRRTGLLMEGDDPAGGQWNYDHDNRKPAREGITHEPLWFEPDAVTEEVLTLVEAKFCNNFGSLRPFGFATERGQALEVLAHFVDHALPKFGDFQDAMLDGNRFLYHSLLSAYLNIGLLTPLEVCETVEKAYEKGDVPINAAEGFIRQIIGWREYVRGIYFREGPEYPKRNVLKHNRKLPEVYWGGPTGMRCMEQAVAQTREEAYAHHIQRLMVTGNFGLLAGIDPHALHEWYLSVYIDAFEWVEAPNTVGMSQFADGGIIASKPYVSSGNYIDRMSDHCKKCSYDVKAKTGEKACPFNLLYWHFMDRHRDRFEGNPRMAQMYRTFDRMDADRRDTVLREAGDLLARLDAGEAV